MTVQCSRENKGCTGVLDMNNAFNLQTGCRSYTVVYPCSECGRVSSLRGPAEERYAVGMYRRSGEEVYIKNDELIYKSPSCDTCDTEMDMDEETYDYACPLCHT